MLKQHSKFLLLSVLSCLTLSACQTTAANEQNAKISSAIENAAKTAMSKGQTKENLMLLEKVYKRNPDSTEAAVNYAKALRRNGFLYKSEALLSPFANNREGADISALVEFANIQMEMGNHSTAESYARKAIKKDDHAFSAYHALAIALDAQGNHSPAESAYRRALDIWEGDPVPVMNNLALNLASQEKIKESIDILEQAKTMAPQRREIERNLRIIRTLNEPAKPIGDYIRPAPKPKKKPV